MGLPLFVAPVESDLPKTARKTASSSPPRSAIRRLAHISAARERASFNRRARTFEHHETRRAPPGLDEIDSITASSSPTDVATVARYISMGFMNSSDLGRRDHERDQRRSALMENMEARFGPGWQSRDWENPQQDLSSDWWMVQPRLHHDGSARLTRLMGHRFDFGRSRNRPRHIDIVPSASWPNPRAGSSRISPLSGPLRQERPERPAPRRPLPTDANGLGDRERSLSPEGWDTLLTTLTPDPQPPSASSSFVSSAAASQSAGASSNTSMSGQPTVAESAPEPPCDSGCENSDSEENELPYVRRSTARTPALPGRPVRPAEHPFVGNVRFHVPNYTVESSQDDGMSLALPVPHLATYHRRPSPLSQARSGEPERSASPLGNHSRHGVWVGRLSVGASDEELTANRSHEGRGGFTTSGNRTPQGDEDWTGMQRIMRSLAHREDIPDEWWAEAGLSRTLARQARD